MELGSDLTATKVLLELGRAAEIACVGTGNEWSLGTVTGYGHWVRLLGTVTGTFTS